jgi:hypothetical protein
MNVLIACEYSGRVRDAFRERGHNALSCDLRPTERPGPHYQGDVRHLLLEGWDLLIAHPDCTFLCSSGMHWTRRGLRDPRLTEDAIRFVRDLDEAPIPRSAIENPVGVLSSVFRKPDQYIQPYEFGDDASKRTCLWLKGLPPLRPTLYVPPRWVCGCGHTYREPDDRHGCPNCGGERGPARPRWANQTDSGQNRLGPSETRGKDRALTYQGWADAMAEQWGALT